MAVGEEALVICQGGWAEEGRIEMTAVGGHIHGAFGSLFPRQQEGRQVACGAFYLSRLPGLSDIRSSPIQRCCRVLIRYLLLQHSIDREREIER